MKTYNIAPVEREFPFGKLSVICLGERGRGSYEYVVPCEDAPLLAVAATKTGKAKLIKSQSNAGFIARVSAQGCYTRGTEGLAFVHTDDQHKVKVIASGNGSYGAAGRIGTWQEYLMEIRGSALIRVKPSGGEHKYPHYFLHFNDETGEVLKLNSQQELDAWIDATGQDYEIPNEWGLAFEPLPTVH